MIPLIGMPALQSGQSAAECIEYYGGEVVGVSSIFSAADEIHGEQINTIFRTEDIPNYETHSAAVCKVFPVVAVANNTRTCLPLIMER